MDKPSGNVSNPYRPRPRSYSTDSNKSGNSDDIPVGTLDNRKVQGRNAPEPKLIKNGANPQQLPIKFSDGSSSNSENNVSEDALDTLPVTSTGNKEVDGLSNDTSKQGDPSTLESHNTFMKWLSGITEENKKEFSREVHRNSKEDVKQLQVLKYSDSTKKLDVPEKTSINAPTKTQKLRSRIKKIFYLAFAILSLCFFLGIGVIAFEIVFPILIVAVVILVFTLSMLIVLGQPPADERTKIINLDQKSVKAGIGIMIHDIFKKIDIDQNASIDYEIIKETIEKTIENGKAFKIANKLNNLIKKISIDDSTLSELDIDMYKEKVKQLTQEMFSSLFSEIKSEIEDKDFYPSFLKAKQQYFESLTEKGFKTDDNMVFSYLFLHNLGTAHRAYYRRDDMSETVEQGITEGIQKYTKMQYNN